MKYRFTRTRTALPTRHQYSASRHWILRAWLRGGRYKMVRLLWQQSPSSYKNYKDFLDDPVIHCTRDLRTCSHSSTTENMYTNVHSSATCKTIQNQKYFIRPSAAEWEARFHVFIYERMGAAHVPPHGQILKACRKPDIKPTLQLPCIWNIHNRETCQDQKVSGCQGLEKNRRKLLAHQDDENVLEIDREDDLGMPKATVQLPTAKWWLHLLEHVSQKK